VLRLFLASVIALTFVCGLLPFEADASRSFQVRESQPQISAATLSFLASQESAADQKVWIYFTDKNIFNEDTYREKLTKVAASLDAHAAARRLKTLGPVLVDFRDIPVHDEYVSQLEQLGVEVVWESRWLNAVSAYGSLSTLEEIATLPFVQKITRVARGGSDRSVPAERGDAELPPVGEKLLIDYGESFGQLDEINVVAAHDAGWSGAGVRIAMLDTGYYRDHQAFQLLLSEGRLIAQWDFINNDGETQDEPGDSEGQHAHGTTTWSVTAGYHEGELIGAAYGADYLLAKTEDTTQEDPIEEDNWMAAMEWADGLGADVISSSLIYTDWYDYSDLDGDTAVTTIAADIAASRGIVVCNGAGNYGTQDWYYIGAPADADSILAVGASEPDGSMWSDSSHGPTADGRTKPEVVARGSMTYAAAWPEDHGGEEYRHFDGTSMSTPLVAGSAALILEAFPNWANMMVRESLMMTADNAETPDNHRGWGRIDVTAALAYTSSSAPEVSLTPSDLRLRVSPNPSRSFTTLVYDLPEEVSGPAILELFSPDGRRVRSFRLADSGVILWDGRDSGGHLVAPGVYLARLRSGGHEVAGKMILSR
jgi:subtilisin family serine protease